MPCRMTAKRIRLTFGVHFASYCVLVVAMSAPCIYPLVLSVALTVALLLLCVSLQHVPELAAAAPQHHDFLQEFTSNNLSTILDPASKQLSPSTTYSDIAHALALEYMPGAEVEGLSWENLEHTLRAMQTAEELGYRTNPSGALANTTYYELRNALTNKYYTNSSLSSALEIMFKMENSMPIPIEGQPYLFVGSVGPAYNLTALEEMRITHIISVTSRGKPQFPDEFRYLHIQGVRDDPKDPKQSLTVHFNATAAFIDDARRSGGRCYVHCWDGQSRSVTLIAAYLIQREEMTREAALRLIRRSRPTARPNSRFMSELEQLSINVHSRIADDLNDRLSTNMRILKSDGSLADWVQYSTLRRALITGNWTRINRSEKRHGREASWDEVKDGLDSMRQSEACAEANATNLDGPLAYVTYSQLEAAILGRYPMPFMYSHGVVPKTVASDSSTKEKDDKLHPLATSLRIMRQMEIDGEPVPIEYFFGKTRPCPQTMFIGSIGAAYNLPILFELGITHIITFSKANENIYTEHFEYFLIENHGNSSVQELYENFDTSYKFIMRATQGGGKVLVHCHDGLSRSSTIISAFLIRHKKTSAMKALDIIRQTRSRAEPNQLIMRALEKYAQKIQIREQMFRKSKQSM